MSNATDINNTWLYSVPISAVFSVQIYKLTNYI